MPDVKTKSRVSEIWELLETVHDPEVPVLTVVDLGVVREVRETGKGIEVSVPLPTPAAPQ